MFSWLDKAFRRLLEWGGGTMLLKRIRMNRTRIILKIKEIGGRSVLGAHGCASKAEK